MDPHKLTNNLNQACSDQSQAMQTIQNGQNLSHTPYQSKEQISATADLRFSAEGNQDSPRLPQEFLNSAKAQSSTSNGTLSASWSAQNQMAPEAALKLLQDILRSKNPSVDPTADPTNIGALSNSNGVFVGPDTPSAVYHLLRGMSEAQKEVSAFDKDSNGQAGSESLADKPQSVFGYGQAQLASSAEHHNRDNMMNQATFNQNQSQQQFAGNQSQMHQQPHNVNMIHYLQNFLAVQSTAQPITPGGQLYQIPVVFDNQQVQQQQFLPQIQQFVQTFNMPQNGGQMIQPQMTTLPQFNQVLAQMQSSIKMEEQHLMQQLQEQQRLQMSQQMAAQTSQQNLTMESLLRQLSGQQMLKEQQSLEELTRALASAGYFNNTGCEIGLQNFYSSNMVCSSCQQGGELICCQSCKKPYHLMCAGLQQLPQRWECEVCTIQSRDNLIRQLKEKAHKKKIESEKRKEEERQAKNEAKLKRELEAKQRKEEKDRQREEQRKQRAEILAQAASQRREEALKLRLQQQQLSLGKDLFIDPETNQPYPVHGPLREGQERYELLDLIIQLAAQNAHQQPKQMQLVFGPNGTMVPSNQQTKKKKVEVELSSEEKQRLERIRLIKQQFQIFSNLYPELVDRNSVRYPIKDELLIKLPELHGCSANQKPEPYKIFVDADEFEKLIYIWEFCNNFNDYLDTPSFKLEDLKCALSYTEAEDPNSNLTVQEEQQLDWNEQMRVRHIREKGLHLINALHTSLVTCFLDDFFPDNSTEEQTTGGANTRSAANQPSSVQLVTAHGDRENQILQAIDKLIENKDEVWPEIIRLVLLYQIEVQEEDFGPNRDTVDDILVKLVGMRPNQYTTQFTFAEKVCLMTVLIDGIHDTDTFRKSLNDRVEEKSSFNKEKIEIYQIIRQLEQEQQELVKKHAESDFVSNEETINKELEELYQKLKVASRVQSRDLKERINELEQEKNHFLNENARLDDLIKKKHAHIAKLNEKLYKSSIKTTMLGQDAQRSEYWHFKDDCSRIYIRKEDVQTTDAEMADANQEVIVTDAIAQPKVVYSWYYYDREEQLDQLIERLNYKGLRERRLQESLRRVKDILKLKKTRKTQKAQDTEQKAETIKPDQDEKADESKPSDDSQVEKSEMSAKVDDPMNGETEPVADGTSKNIDENNDEVSESEPQADRHVMFETDDFDACLMMAVWFGKKVPGKRRTFGRGSNKFEASEFGENPVTLQECKNIILRIQSLYTDSSRSHDREWTDKPERDQWIKLVGSAQSCSELMQLMIRLDEGMNQPFFLTHRGGQNQRLKLLKFKFWPSSDLKTSWQEYVEDKNSLKNENLNAFYIILRILERINEQFLVRQDEKMEKKNKAAINAACNGNEVRQNALATTSRGGRPRDVNYVKYFESSDSENELPSALMKNAKKNDDEEDAEEESEEESEDEPDQTNGAKSVASARQQRAMQRKKKPEPAKSAQAKAKGGKKRVVESESENESSSSEQFSESEEESEEEVKRPARGRGLASERSQPTSVRGRGRGGRGGRATRTNAKEESEESESEESSDEDGTERSWDEYCFVCNDGGNVLCCESCTQVAHVQCLKLRSAPTGDWHCPDCLKKQTQKRLTRTQDNKYGKDTRSTRNSGKPIKAMRRY